MFTLVNIVWLEHCGFLKCMGKSLVNPYSSKALDIGQVEDCHFLCHGQYLFHRFSVRAVQASMVQYNEKTLKKMHDSTYSHPESSRSLLSNYDSQERGNCSAQNVDSLLPPGSEKDIEMPMPPLWLAPLQQHNSR